MPTEHVKLQLLVITSGCALVHPKDGENIFPMSLIKTGSDDRKLQCSPLNCVEVLVSVVTMPTERAKLQLPVVNSGFALGHPIDGENNFPMSLIKTGSDDRKLQFRPLNCVKVLVSVVTMPTERAKLQLPVITSGCALGHPKDGKNIFPMSLIKPEVTTGGYNLAH